MGGYLLLALGLINWQYQNADSGIATRSLIIVLPGVTVILMTFIKAFDSFLASKLGMSLVATAVALLVGLSFLY
jgi:hypothetical protein